MHVGEKKKTLKLLEKLRVYNQKSAYIYRIFAENEKRLLLKNFYRKLYEQKLNYLIEIEESIDCLKKEISPLKDPRALAFYKRKKCELSKFYMRYKLTNRFDDIHKREWKAFRKYNKYLSKTSHALARELILSHKHGIKKYLNEINSSGIMKFPIA